MKFYKAKIEAQTTDKQERRRRLFEDYCISKKLDVAGMCGDDWRGVWVDVERILNEADAFANKGRSNMSRKIKFNCNDYVYVTLTDLGEKIWRESYLDLGMAPPEKVPDRFQLWHLMQTFGHAMRLAVPTIPIANNEIIFEVADEQKD